MLLINSLYFIFSDIDISLNGGNGVAIQNFENYDINIKADNGICQLKNIKVIDILSSH